MGVEDVKKETRSKLDKLLIDHGYKGFESEIEALEKGLPDVSEQQKGDIEKFLMSVPEDDDFCDRLLKGDGKKEEKVASFKVRFKEKLEELKLTAMAAILVVMTGVKFKSQRE
ncbi:MAG TPA: hypothetical protein PK370_02680 [Candidatus Woesebacteria bacterium]|nr:hypothetical protein [Candidatus Woesebacteria bacterium]HPJ17278.1 hypothetical protein [Candidatus Woesebacteria bacterium]